MFLNNYPFDKNVSVLQIKRQEILGKTVTMKIYFKLLDWTGSRLCQKFNMGQLNGNEK